MSTAENTPKENAAGSRQTYWFFVIDRTPRKQDELANARELAGNNTDKINVTHQIVPAMVDVHKRVGDARLLRMLGHYSIGQGHDALHDVCAKAGEGSTTAQKLAAELNARDVTLLTLLDPEYPACFRELESDAPPFLYVQGDVARLKARSVAIIGTRRPSAPGKAATVAVAENLVREGWTIVSGNAPGVDSTAHEAALKAGGDTLVCPPAPMDQYVQSFRTRYPARTTVVSPFAPGIAVEPWMFLRRNTLVSAQCHAAFVAETGTRGGTLDTVKKLKAMGRPVFATELPEEAQHRQAHAMLTTDGRVKLLDVSGHPSTWLPVITAAAGMRRNYSGVSAPVLDDLFPQEFLNE